MTEPTETARELLWRHQLPEDVIDGALCLHAQELAAVQRKAISETDDPVFYEGEAGWLVSLIEPEAATDQAAPELTAEEARNLADELSTDLYRAQDALAFVEECCVIADREGRQPTTADVREWLKGARCGRQLAADARDQAALRDRIAEAVRDAACNGDCGKTEEECARTRIQPVVWHHGRLAVIEGTPEQIADAVLAVLPTPADRANVLRVAADAVALDRDATAGSRAGARQGMTRAVNLLRRMAAEAAPATGHDDSETGDCCGALPPDLFIDEAGREWHAGDCWCTLAPGHSDQHRCQPCTDRVGAPGWTDGPPAAAQQPKTPALFCVCGAPANRDGDRWTHQPGTGDHCMYRPNARPRCPDCRLPHDLTPGGMAMRACASILASIADRDAAAQQPKESAPAVPQCDGCGHLVHRARKCPALQYGERCECDEPLATDGEARS